MQVAATPADVARKADIIFAMLSDPPAALAVATGADGIVEGKCNTTSTAIHCSTTADLHCQWLNSCSGLAAGSFSYHSSYDSHLSSLVVLLPARYQMSHQTGQAED
jgi:hypothetical protein